MRSSCEEQEATFLGCEKTQLTIMPIAGEISSSLSGDIPVKRRCRIERTLPSGTHGLSSGLED